VDTVFCFAQISWGIHIHNIARSKSLTVYVKTDYIIANSGRLLFSSFEGKFMLTLEGPRYLVKFFDFGFTWISVYEYFNLRIGQVIK